jgi:hypothetical protein
MSEEWLQNLKAGDKVIVQYHDASGPEVVQTVKRITPTGKIVVGSFSLTTFNSNGRHRIGKWYSDRLHQYTPEREEEIVTKNYSILLRRKFINGVNWHSIPLEKLKQVNAILFPETDK